MFAHNNLKFQFLEVAASQPYTNNSVLSTRGAQEKNRRVRVAQQTGKLPQ